MPLPLYERQVVYYAMLGPCVLSIVGAGFMCAMYASFPKLRTFPFKLIIVLSIIDIFNSAAAMIPVYSADNNSVACQMQAALLNFTTLAGGLWSTVIAIYLYSAVIKSKSYESRTIIKALLAILGFCLIITIIPWTIPGSAYGRNSGWCWITHDNEELRFLSFFIPIWIIIPVNTVIYFQVARRIFSIAGLDQETKLKRKLKQKLLFYPLILAICYAPYTIKAILEFSHIKSQHFEFTCAAGVLRCLNGFLNTLIYGLNPTVRKNFKRCITRAPYTNYSSMLTEQEANSIYR